MADLSPLDDKTVFDQARYVQWLEDGRILVERGGENHYYERTGYGFYRKVK